MRRLPLPAPRPSALFAAAVGLWLSGCSLFGPETARVTFETLVRSDTLVTGSSGSRPLEVVVLRTDADLATFVTTHTLAAPLPAVDFAASSVVGVIFRATEPGGSVVIGTVEREGGMIHICAVYDGPAVTDSSATSFPAHLVTTPRLEGDVTGYQYRSVGGIAGDC